MRLDPKTVKFDGVAVVPERDNKRLSTQHERIFALMMDRRWRTLSEISKLTNAPEASASAALRDFRKERFGSHTVNRRHIKNGLFAYQLETNEG